MWPWRTICLLCFDELEKGNAAEDHRTFFGMGFQTSNPPTYSRASRKLVSPDDVLLFSANLAPEPDYADGVRSSIARLRQRGDARLAVDIFV